MWGEGELKEGGEFTITDVAGKTKSVVARAWRTWMEEKWKTCTFRVKRKEEYVVNN